MLFQSALLLLCAATAIAVPAAPEKRFTKSVVCQQIETAIAGDVLYSWQLLSAFYDNTNHYMTSSSQPPMCVVQVSSPEDVSKVLTIVGTTKTPFAVKSGGHASNPGFSSTPGVFISLVKLKQINISADKKTVEVGLGNLWTEVYAGLDSSGLHVVGGRVPGPGTGGFTLGGGYSWLTNQYGLTVDTVNAFNVVLPNGTITTADASNPDLYFALKGGLNRFGIVTSIVLKTFPKPDKIWGGNQFYGSDAIPALIVATDKFQRENTDDKAQVILTINGGTVPGGILLLFYDGPTRPAAFDVYKGINPIIDGAKSQSYVDFINSTPSALSGGHRGAFHTLSTTGFTKAFLDATYNETKFYSKQTLLRSGGLLSYDVEPFRNYGRHATDSSFPHEKSQLPLNLYFAWDSASQDAYWRGAMQTSVNYLTELAKKEGIFDESLPAYSNYALDTYSGAQLYGRCTERLRQVQQKYDPNGVMLLAGGFTI